MSETKAGIVAALDFLAELGPVVASSARQLPLPAIIADDDAAPSASGERKAGRPLGARNRRTAAMIDYLAQRYRSPLQALAEMWSRSVEQLAVELHCTRLEAFQEQRRALEASLPYWHQRQPQALELPDGGLPVLIFGAANAALARSEVIDLYAEENAEVSRFSEHVERESQASESQANAQPPDMPSESEE